MVTFDGPVDVSEHPDGYTVWEPQGHVVAEVADGETVENLLIRQDMDRSVQIEARDGGNVIRNVGWEGVTRSAWEGDGPVFLLSAKAEAGRELVVENVFMTGWGTSTGGFWCGRSHAGLIRLRNSYFAGFGNNSCYLSGQSKNGGNDGTVDIDGCYTESSTTGNFRVSGHDSIVSRCLAVMDDPDCSRGHYPNNNDAYTSRPFAARHRTVDFVDCVAYVAPDHCEPGGAFQAWHCGSGCTSNGETVMRLDNCHINADAPEQIAEILGGRIEGSPGHDPTLEYFRAAGGVPTSAEMAARGERVIPEVPQLPDGGGGNGGNGDPTPGTSTVLITNDGSAETDWSVEVADGEIIETIGFGPGDSVSDDGRQAVGFVRGGEDGFRYTGCIRAFSYDGPKPTVTLDGESVNADAVVECPPQDGGGGNGDDGVDRAVQAAGALAIGGSILKIIRDR